MDPTSPKSFFSRLAGLVLVLGVLLFAFSFARNRVAPTINGLMSNVGLGSDAGGGGIEVFR